MGFVDAFIGTPHSKISGIAIILAIIVLFIGVIFSKNINMPLVNKLGIAFIVLIISVPSVLYHLFNITCLVTGKGIDGEKWWCNAYAWLISVVTVLFSAFVIIVTINFMILPPTTPTPTTTPITPPTTPITTTTTTPSTTAQ
jgi:Mn2+/Fe2+ NRAMP family transporter